MQDEDRTSGRTLWSAGSIVVVVLLALVAALVVGFGSWIPVSYSGQLNSTGPCSSSCPPTPITSEAIPAGVNVAVRWAATSGGGLTFYIIGPGRPFELHAAACGSAGVSGSCSFPSEGGWYGFGALSTGSQANQTVDFTWSYLVPIL
jgi:hypothetical protein